MQLIVAFQSVGFGMGVDGRIPWRIPEDMTRFATITAGSVVVMGRRTWDSLPARPLRGRTNVVVTSKPPEQKPDPSVVFTDVHGLDDTLSNASSAGQDVFVIGGARLFARFLPVATRIHATLVTAGHVECDAFFDPSGMHRFRIADASPERTAPDGVTRYRFVTYEPAGADDENRSFVGLVRAVLERGLRRPDRTGVGTVSLFAPDKVTFGLTGGTVPLMTVKRVPWRSVVCELLMFLKGRTSSKDLEADGVGIWTSNTSREFLDARGLGRYAVGDMGPMYGFQWRHYGAEYRGCDAAPGYAGQGFDQLRAIIEGIRADPWSRRHVMTCFNPVDAERSVLHPCHGTAVQFYVGGDDDGVPRTLRCCMFQRSCDLALGFAFNVAEYALLTHLIAAWTGLVAEELSVFFGDCHLYADHASVMAETIRRPTVPFPRVRLSDTVRDKAPEDLVPEDLELVGYACHPAVRLKMAV